MKLRTIRRDDWEQLLLVWNRSAPHDVLSAALLEEKIWADSEYDQTLTRIALANNQVVGWGLAVHRRQPAGRGHLKFLAVDGPFQRQGIGSRILVELERELRLQGCAEFRIDEASPNYLNPGIDVRYASGRQFLQKHGYHEIGTAVHQRVELAGHTWSTESDETRLRASGIAVQRANRTDQQAVWKWLQVHWPTWMQEVQRAFDNDPVTMHLAWQSGAVIGFAAYDTNNLGLGWFGPMGTDPACRGHGVGRILLYRCLSDQRRQGYSQVIIPWVGPVEFYRKQADAQVWRTFCRLAKPP